METFHMSRDEIDQITVFEQLKDKAIPQTKAAEQLKLSLRQVQRKLAAYRKSGTTSLVHGARGTPGNHRLDSSIKEQAVVLVEQYYSDFKPTFAAEKLKENHGLAIGHETLRLLMIACGIWIPKKRKVTAHLWRERKACFGELVQLDGSPHAWFENRASACTLIAFIDDATSKILWLEFCDGESTINLMTATDSYLKIHGRPLALYTDRGGVFKVNIHNQDEDKKTQYERAIGELAITFIHARSPQAKGRVERLFGTLQDRLVKELRLAHISTIEDANRFVEDVYLSKHNAKFAVEAREPQDLHRSLKAYPLSTILCVKEERIVNQDFTIRYKTRWFQLEKKQPTIVFPKNSITVCEHLDGRVTFSLRTTQLHFQEIPKQPDKLAKETAQRQAPQPSWVPPAHHPWRNYKNLKSDISILVHT